MKTRDRILFTSLLLFNQEGEQNITTVDIANEMDISPGNLYYHFKGKESIIETLYTDYDKQLTLLLNQSMENTLSVEDHWLFIYVLFEEIYKFRFFYLNVADIMFKYPDVERRFRRLLLLKIKTIEALCKSLLERLEVEVVEGDIRFLAENIVQSMMYWFAYQQLVRPQEKGEDLVHLGVYHILSLAAPYIGINQDQYLAIIKKLYKKT